MEIAERQRYRLQKEQEEQDALASSKSKDSEEKKPVAGFDPLELVKAPVAPPSSIEGESKQATSNPRVRFLIYASMVLFLVGFIILLINATFGLVIMALAAVSVILSVFAPIE